MNPIARAGRSARNEIVVDPRSRGVNAQSGYRPELDGIRGLAVLLVVAAHMRLLGPQAGAAGVTAFFVLSGYLITGLLLNEQARSDRIDVVAFYIRRAGRLLPALGLLLLFVAVIGLAGGWPASWGAGVVSSVLYLGNWFRVAGIDTFPLGHTWSLAVEEQFYLAWPLLVVLLARRVWVVAVAGIAVALVGRAMLPEAGVATVTRIDPIFAGCLLALWDIRLPRSVGLAGLALLVIGSLSNAPDAAVLPLVTVAGVMLIAGGGLTMLGTVGRRAYGLYLWHYPLIALVGPVGGVLAFPVVEASYRYVERPALRVARGFSDRRRAARASLRTSPA